MSLIHRRETSRITRESWQVYDPRVTQSIVLEWFLVSYLFCLGRIYCHVIFTSFFIFFHGWLLFILRSTIIARKKKENIGNTQYRGKDRQHQETMPELLYIYT